RDAALPAWLAAWRGGGRRTNGVDQLPAADADLHDDLLRPRPRPFRKCRPGRPIRDRAGSLGVRVAGVLGLAPLLCGGAGGMAVALGRARTSAELPALVDRARPGVTAFGGRPRARLTRRRLRANELDITSAAGHDPRRASPLAAARKQHAQSSGARFDDLRLLVAVIGSCGCAGRP